MQTFPIFLALQDRPVLVVGGGEPAARKVELLLSAGARVTLIADTVVGEIAQLIAEARISWAGRGFDDGDLAGMALVIVATDDEALAARVSHAAQQRSLPVNVVDRPRLSSFIMPAIVDRAPITIAISTGGAAPGAGAAHSRRDRARPAGGDRPAGALRRDLPRAGAPHARELARSPPLLGSRVRRPHRRAGAGRRRDRRAPRADPAARFDAQRERAGRHGASGGRRPRRSRPSDHEGASPAAARRRHRLRPAGLARGAGDGAARRRTHLRRQAARRSRPRHNRRSTSAWCRWRAPATAWCG